MLQKTYKFFNQSTRQAYFERVNGYIAKSYDNDDEEAVQKQYRFDLGENVIGSSPVVCQFLERIRTAPFNEYQLNTYPEVLHQRIRKRIADQHGVNANGVIISTGLDAILDLISRVFFDPKDYYVSLVPSFYLFEDYSERMGALPIFVELDEEDGFEFTQQKAEELKTQITKFKPKMVWIANPNNPTGKTIDLEALEDIIRVAMYNNTFVVVDEAYIEYLSNFEEKSAANLVNKYNNLMVLRTFSKAYGLAGTRIGYMVTSSHDIVEAMLMLRTHFPVTQLALDLASLALSDEQFLKDTRHKTKFLKKELFSKFENLESFHFIKSNTNVFLLKNHCLSDVELEEKFNEHGITTSYVNIPTQGFNQYRRVTLRDSKDNNYLFKVCSIINKQVEPKMPGLNKERLKHKPQVFEVYDQASNEFRKVQMQ